MHTLLSDQDRLKLAATICCGLVTLITLGLASLNKIGKASPYRKLHGRYVLAWMVFRWSIISVCEIAMPGNSWFQDDSPAHLGLACFGMLADWLIAMIHGGSPSGGGCTVKSSVPYKPHTDRASPSVDILPDPNPTGIVGRSIT